MTHECIVVGAGIWGCTLARLLAEAGFKVLIMEARPFLGGNCHATTHDGTGIEIHDFGSHIFHTHSIEVWKFVNRFVAFNGYQHKVLSCHSGRKYFMPLGLALINAFFDVDLKPGEVSSFLSANDRYQKLFDAFFRGYTSKQWGMSPEEIDPSVIKRVPIRTNFDTNYFDDLLQGIPVEGYQVLFDRLVDHADIGVQLKEKVTLPQIEKWLNEGCHVFYSGPIDALLEYEFGALPWRSLRFEREVVPVTDFQGTSVINYPDVSIPYTRVHEFKHYHPEGRFSGKWGYASPETVIMREYPCSWTVGDEPYYPIVNEKSLRVLSQYQEALNRYPNLTIGGRLGLYKYFDMDQSVYSAMQTAKQFIARALGVQG